MQPRRFQDEGAAMDVKNDMILPCVGHVEPGCGALRQGNIGLLYIRNVVAESPLESCHCRPKLTIIDFGAEQIARQPQCWLKQRAFKGIRKNSHGAFSLIFVAEELSATL